MKPATSFFVGLVLIVGGVGGIASAAWASWYFNVPKPDMGWFTAGAMMGAALSMVGLLWLSGTLE